MQLIKEVKINYTFGVILSQVLPIILTVWLVPKEYLLNYSFNIPALILFFMLRYPHEYIHKLSGKLIGFDSTINFKRSNATCTPNRLTTWWEEMNFSVAPLIVQTIALQFMLLIFKCTVANYIYYMVLTIFILSFATYIGDMIFIINTFKHKDCMFKDTGMTLEIYK